MNENKIQTVLNPEEELKP